MNTARVQSKPCGAFWGFLSPANFKKWAAFLLFAFSLAGLRAPEAAAGVWEPTGGPEGGDIRAIAVSPDFQNDRTLFADTPDGRLLKSVDGGASWTFVKPRVNSVDVFVLRILFSPNYAVDKTLFMATFNDGVLKSTDGGVSWTSSNAGLNGSGIGILEASPAYASDRTLFASSFSGEMFKSTDGGASWSALSITTGPTGSLGGSPLVQSLGVSPNYAVDQTVFVATGNGVLKSTDGGTSWASVGSELNGPVGAFVFSPNYALDKTLFASPVVGAGGLFKSTNDGTSWARVTMPGSSGTMTLWSLVLSPNYAVDRTLFIATGDGVFKSTNGGTSWTIANTGLSDAQISFLAISPNYTVDRILFAGSFWGGAFFKSTDGGASWAASNNGLRNTNTLLLSVSPNYAVDRTLVADIFGGGVFKSSDGGTNWSAANNGLGGDLVSMSSNMSSLAFSPNYAADQTLFAGIFGLGVFKSTNGGAGWTAVNTGLNNTGIASLAISPNYAVDQTLFGGSSVPGGVVKSTNGGMNWVSVSAGLDSAVDINSLAVSPNYSDDQTLFIGTSRHGVFKSNNGGASWMAVNTGLGSNLVGFASVSSVVISPNYTVDQTLFGVVGVGGGTPYKSTDGGATWTPVDTSTSAPPGSDFIGVTSLVFSPNYAVDRTVFIGGMAGGAASGGIPTSVVTFSGGVFKSSDGGITWAAAGTEPAILGTTTLAISPNYPCDGTLFAGTNGSSVWKYTDTEAMAACPSAPKITAFTSAAAAGQTVTLSGANFGATQGTSTVTLGGAMTAVTSWSDSQIVVTVPAGATDGPIVVTVNGIPVTAAQTFTLLHPRFTLSATPDAQNIESGQSAAFTITVQGLDGFNSPVNFNPPFGFPAGVSAALSTGSALPSGSVTLTVKTSSLLPSNQTIPIKINASGGGWSAMTTVGLGVLDWKDFDNDSLPDHWERDGIKNEQGEMSLNLPAMGADPNHKDIFVEVDYMCETPPDCNDGHSHKPYKEAIDKVIKAFAAQNIALHVDNGGDSVMNPVINNIDGSIGGSLWGNRSKANSIGEVQVLGFQISPNPCTSTASTQQEEVHQKLEAIKEAINPDTGKVNFESVRARVFHYALFAHDIGTYNDKNGECQLNRNSGISKGVPGSDFIVSLGSFDKKQGKVMDQAGTFMHELGHNLGLGHGGPSDLDNNEQVNVGYKPNYLSVMNYSFQFSGLYTPNGSGVFDYSRFDDKEIGVLYETNLDETKGLQPITGTNNNIEGYRTVYYGTGCPPLPRLPWDIENTAVSGNVNAPINWNCDIDLFGHDSSVQNRNINKDFNKDGTPKIDILKPYNDWKNLKFSGGPSSPIGGATGAALPLGPLATPSVDLEELTPEEDALIPKLFAVLVSNPGNKILPQGKSTTSLFTIKNKGVEPDNYTLTATSSRGWSNLGGIPPSVSLLPGEEFIFEVQTTVPATVANGDADTLTIRADSAGSSGLLDLSIVTITAFDGNPPTITASVSPLPDAAGVNNTDVTVTFACADAESGIASCTGPITVTTNGAGQVITGTAVDLAGNTSAASVTLNIDKTPPALKGDLNADGCIDRADYNSIIADIRNGAPNDPAHDLNGDGVVNAADARTLIGLFTNPRGAPCL